MQLTAPTARPSPAHRATCRSGSRRLSRSHKIGQAGDESHRQEIEQKIGRHPIEFQRTPSTTLHSCEVLSKLRMLRLRRRCPNRGSAQIDDRGDVSFDESRLPPTVPGDDGHASQASCDETIPKSSHRWPPIERTDRTGEPGSVSRRACVPNCRLTPLGSPFASERSYRAQEVDLTEMNNGDLDGTRTDSIGLSNWYFISVEIGSGVLLTMCKSRNLEVTDCDLHSLRSQSVILKVSRANA